MILDTLNICCLLIVRYTMRQKRTNSLGQYLLNFKNFTKTATTVSTTSALSEEWLFRCTMYSADVSAVGFWQDGRLSLCCRHKHQRR